MRTKKRERPWTPEDGEKFEAVGTGNALVKIYRRERLTRKGGRRVVYELADYTAGVRRLRGFSKLGKARAKAKDIADKLSSGNRAAAEMDNAAAVSYGRAAQLLPPGVSMEFAADTYAKAFAVVGDRIIEACNYFAERGADKIIERKVADVVAELVAHREAQKKSRRYVNDLRARLSRFAENYAVDISSISTANVQTWLDGLKLSARSTKNFRGALGTLFKFAEARQYIARGQNPVDGTERISSNGDGEIEIYSCKELAALLKHAGKDFRPFVALGAFAGLRSAEIERLAWADIDLAAGFITVGAAKAKTRSRRLVPILPNLAQWLAPYAKKRGNVWTGNERDLLDARADCATKAGVTWKANALRHSFISYRLAAVQDAAKVALEAGNSPAMVFRHYRELVKPAAAETYFAIAPETPGNVLTISQKEAAL